MRPPQFGGLDQKELWNGPTSDDVFHGRDRAMPISREYRQRAGDCLRLANETKELYAKMALLEMAAEFRALAQQLELRERRRRQRSCPATTKRFSAR
jgi:hypothetical protein